MKKSTKQTLNQLNKTFYEKNAQSFSDTRQYFWPGWGWLKEEFDKLGFSPTKALDVGCGNGRFGEFLTLNYPKVSYTGIDFSKQLINKSKLIPNGEFKIIDLTQSVEIHTLDKGFDLITLMAVLHHIPGFEERVEILKNLSGHLSHGGIFVMTFWEFLKEKSIKQKTIGWDVLNIDQSEIEEGDYLLDWNGDRNNLRFCHFANSEEQQKLITESGLRIIKDTLSDGRSGKLNHYYILSKA